MRGRLDSQQVELVARAALEAELIKHGFEVARPHRDHGVDLIVYLDQKDHFAALPIQMKSSSGTAFGAWRKFERISNLVLVYVWHVMSDDKKPCFFVMSVADAINLVPAKRREKRDWNEASNPGWRWSKAPKELKEKLKRFENRWDWLRKKLEASL